MSNHSRHLLLRTLDWLCMSLVLWEVFYLVSVMTIVVSEIEQPINPNVFYVENTQ